MTITNDPNAGLRKLLAVATELADALCASVRPDKPLPSEEPLPPWLDTYESFMASKGLESERPGGPGEGTTVAEPLPATAASRREGVTPLSVAGPDDSSSEVLPL